MEINNYTLTPLFSKDIIDKKISEIAKKISEQFEKKNPIFIGVLNGSFIFLADLIRKINIECEMDFIKLHSYEGNKSSGTIQLIKDISANITDRHVILVEDIVDTGYTIRFLKDRLMGAKPKSVTITTLLLKPDMAKIDFPIDFVGFEISPEFVVGYGLDLDQKFRHLDGIYRINKKAN